MGSGEGGGGVVTGGGDTMKSHIPLPGPSKGSGGGRRPLGEVEPGSGEGRGGRGGRGG